MASTPPSEPSAEREQLTTRIKGWAAPIGLFLLTASKAVDLAYRLFDGLREELVLLLGSDDFMRRYNDYVYGRHAVYTPGSKGYRAPFLWEWEEAALRDHFPPPPAHILVGGAGGGREAIALAERGYRVSAFECAPALVAGMRDEVQRLGLSVDLYRGRYEDLFGRSSDSPESELAHGSDIPPLPRAEHFEGVDGVILGWGSLIHILQAEDRLNLLKACGTLCHEGPILLSFVAAADDRMLSPGVVQSRRYPVWSHGGSSANSWWQRLRARARQAKRRSRNDAFWVHFGMGHLYTQQEITSLAEQAGYSVAAFRTSMEAGWDHAVLARIPPSKEKTPGTDLES